MRSHFFCLTWRLDAQPEGFGLVRVIELLARKMGCLCRLDIAEGRRWAGVLNGGLGDGLWMSDILFLFTTASLAPKGIIKSPAGEV